jgi:hypothetical protein
VTFIRARLQFTNRPEVTHQSFAKMNKKKERIRFEVGFIISRFHEAEDLVVSLHPATTVTKHSKSTNIERIQIICEVYFVS